MKYYPMFDLFDDFFTGNTTSDVMKTDIVEKDGNYEMSMELPGVKKEDIQMELKDGYLKVTATHGSNTEDKDEKGRVVRKERISGSYSTISVFMTSLVVFPVKKSSNKSNIG